MASAGERARRGEWRRGEGEGESDKERERARADTGGIEAASKDRKG